MTMIAIEIDDREVLAVFHELARRVDDLSSALKAIGEDMAESTKQRFATSRGPDGQAWPGNSDVTLQRYLGLFSGSRKKDGSLSKKGAARADPSWFVAEALAGGVITETDPGSNGQKRIKSNYQAGDDSVREIRPGKRNRAVSLISMWVKR
jgi:hypothetical protein